MTYSKKIKLLKDSNPNLSTAVLNLVNKIPDTKLAKVDIHSISLIRLINNTHYQNTI